MKTSIEWTDFCWNPVRGCSRISRGCEHCYAERMAARHLPGMRSPTTGKPYARMTPQGPHWTGRVELIPEKLDEPLRWRTPRRVFVNSMSDLFHEALSDEAIDRVFAVMAMCDGKHSSRAGHTFQVLTKRPERMARYFADPETSWRIYSEVVRVNIGGYRPRILPADERGYRGLDTGQWPLPLPNVWLGVSPHDQESADWMIPLLLQTPAAKRFVSLEPLLGPVDPRPYVALLDVLCCPRCGFRTNRQTERACPNDGVALGPDVRLDQVIVGGESGPGARPCHVSWIRSVVRQCREAGVACFVKQGGASNRCEHSSKGGHFECFPPDLQVREFPNA